MKRLLLAGLMLLAAACGESNSTAPIQTRTATVYLALNVAPLAHAGIALDSAVVTVSASDISGVGRYVLPAPAGKDTVSANLNLPVGTARVVDVAVYAGGAEIGEGVAVADVVEGVNPPLAITIYAVSGTGASATGFGVLPIGVTTQLYTPTISPKFDTLAVNDTARFRLLDPTGKAVADPVNFPATWTYSTTQYIPSVKGVGLIAWTTPGSLCGYIDASGLFRALQSGCDVKLVGTIGTASDTAFVHIR